MRLWLPCRDTLRDLIVDHLPSPADAQQYRCANLYSGPMDDEAAKAVRACDPRGPLMLYVSKLVPNANYSRFFALARIFSGTVSTGTPALWDLRVRGAHAVVLPRAQGKRCASKAPSSCRAARPTCWRSASTAACCSWLESLSTCPLCRRATSWRWCGWRLPGRHDR
jgi:hypothetical protein